MSKFKKKNNKKRNKLISNNKKEKKSKKRDVYKPKNISIEQVTKILEESDRPLSAGALAHSFPFDVKTREVGLVLEQMVSAKTIIETRPGKFLISGTNGEFSGTIVNGDDGRVKVSHKDRILDIHPLHTLNAKNDDSVIFMINDDGLALLTKISHREGRKVVGSLSFHKSKVEFVFDNRKEGTLPAIANNKIMKEYNAGDRVLGYLESDGDRKFVRLDRLLNSSDPDVGDFEYIVLSHDLPGKFPDDIIEEAKRKSDEEMLVDNRIDLRDEFIFTIDPKTAKDFDDAVSIEQTNDGGWKLGVHIADVSCFVEEGGVIDTEAFLRGTSTYLINRVIPMLPQSLSNGACSLRPNEDKYALSVFIELDKKRNIISVTPAETIINSKKRLNYNEAQKIIEGQHSSKVHDKIVIEKVMMSHNLAQALRKDRTKSGALNLYSVERSFTLDSLGNPVEIESSTSNESHQLIEEFMLLANKTVAKWLDGKESACVYRNHAAPDEDRLKIFKQALHSYGIKETPTEKQKDLQRILKLLEKEPKASRMMLNFMCLRCFQKADYDINNIGHYALAFSHYAHFTSPIRRYPDLVVHRLVKVALEIENYKPTSIERIDASARTSSGLERRSETAERHLFSIKAARYMEKRIGDSFQAVVMTAVRKGFFATIMEVGMDVFVHVKDLGKEFYEYDPESAALVSRSGKRYATGTEIEVVITAVDINRAEVSAMVEEDVNIKDLKEKGLI